MIRLQALSAALISSLAFTFTAGALPAQAASDWTPRGEQYPTTVAVKDLAIKVSDGVTLRGDLQLPSTDGKTAVSGTWPVVITITAYNKTVIAGGFGATLAGADPAYLVKRGYAQLTVDARGTGSSEGAWCAFCARENKDAAEIVAWAADQPWSDGTSAMTGASYMGISQIFAAAGKPKGLKAIFPQVPGADVYRDVVASGGQLDVGFIPLWLGLVTVTGLIPPAVAQSDPKSAFTELADHLTALNTFTVPLLLKATLGGESAWDGPFYAERSPINVVDNVDVPTFFVSGEFDLFQRGTPLLFENLRKRDVPTKLIIGPWDHLQGSSGAEVGKAGYGTLAELQLRWFDHYVKGMDDDSLDDDIANLTYFEQGTGEWKTSDDWVGDDRSATTWKLSGNSLPLLKSGALTTGTPKSGSSIIPPVPLSGLCSRSMNQWTAGIVNLLPLPNPCLSDNTLNDATGVVFQSAPVTEDQAFQGPINAHLFVASTSGDGMMSVAVEDVAPNGKVARLTGGWQVISLRKLDSDKSRYLDDHLIQPYHPFTQASRSKLRAGKPAAVDVEIFPTGARILKGHRLRLAIQAFDVPHLLPNLTLAFGSASILTLKTGPTYPSAVTLPALK
jgi:putative CocE/NonD family hydrolase